MNKLIVYLFPILICLSFEKSTEPEVWKYRIERMNDDYCLQQMSLDELSDDPILELISFKLIKRKKRVVFKLLKSPTLHNKTDNRLFAIIQVRKKNNSACLIETSRKRAFLKLEEIGSLILKKNHMIVILDTNKTNGFCYEFK